MWKAIYSIKKQLVTYAFFGIASTAIIEYMTVLLEYKSGPFQFFTSRHNQQPILVNYTLFISTSTALLFISTSTVYIPHVSHQNCANS